MSLGAYLFDVAGTSWNATFWRCSSSTSTSHRVYTPNTTLTWGRWLKPTNWISPPNRSQKTKPPRYCFTMCHDLFLKWSVIMFILFFISASWRPCRESARINWLLKFCGQIWSVRPVWTTSIFHVAASPSCRESWGLQLKADLFSDVPTRHTLPLPHPPFSFSF